MSTNISLNERTHTYTLKDDPTFEFTSVTEFIHKFFEPFNKHKVATKLLKMSKYAGKTKEDLFAEWSAAAKRGTHVHKELEEYIRKQTIPTTSLGKHGQQWLDEYLEALPEIKIEPEVILYSKALELAGTIDVLFYNPLSDSYTIVDWKTNKRIYTSAYQGKTGTCAVTEDIEDCNFNHYSLQMSLYRYLLETFYKVKVEDQILVHIHEEGVTEYSCPYMIEELERMLKF